MTGDRIICDADGCASSLPLGREVDATTADAIARREGWTVTVGSRRSYHHCSRHSGKEQT